MASIVNMLEAKSNLSRLVDAVESGRQAEIIIARNGKPAARLVPIEARPKGQQIGIAKGEFVVPDDYRRRQRGDRQAFLRQR